VPSIEQRTLGTSGLRVSRLGLGLAALGRPAYINVGHGDDLAGRRDVAALERHSHTVLDAAHAAGITYFDAARSYGRAEEFLGRWLTARGVVPGDVTIGSKWGYAYTGGWQIDAEVHEVKEHTASQFDRQIDETREYVGPHLDLYQIHSVTSHSGVFEDRDVLERLAGLKEAGLAIGFTTSGPGQSDTIRRGFEIAHDGVRLFDTVQATWNLLEPSAGSALAEAHAAGLGVIVKEALANGRLATRSSEIGRRLAERYPDTAVDAIALAAPLHQAWTDVVLSGAATVKQLVSNVAALEVPEPVDLADLAEDPEAYWATRAAMPWT
jgi:aryl-alcohol dehydrogenase-like predicted oxidoreductase